MSTFTLAGHVLAFGDCREVGQGGPEVCTMSIDGHVVMLRYWGLERPRLFHPSPLAWRANILVPLRENARFYLTCLDPTTLNLTKLSRGFAYMRLLRANDRGVEFSTWFDDRETHFLPLN